ncbi:isoprenylcysteine carboxylmethyltransferase family protein [Streptomyces sp. LP05-1]|uniref:Isoprenylcysteine carboxylmethyltransferase family protein n=1 Tax=Streptomyces pyxinae TaxID=2970734 RepID=A0ABT2CDP5_9ACTN|nr:isoprenylcysteine carboxylmethyltransferase family protein [Streptomyces sp. LP05-1]MCS0634744.1 isoprenylcysteine carboxylmethyltransferase family protein [Streptomyces sp. LP05-1]
MTPEPTGTGRPYAGRRTPEAEAGAGAKTGAGAEPDGRSWARRPESWFPPLLFTAGLAALAYGLWHHTGIARIVVALYLLWVLAELRITFRGDPGETGGADRGSMPLYGMARGLVVATALFVPDGWPGRPPAVTALLVAVFAGGVALRLTAIWQLGRFYSHKVRTLSDHRIVRTGPYRFVRHPAYSGMILAHLGFTGLFLNPASAAVTLFLLVPAVMHRIRVEERTLMRLDGYPAYAHGRKRLIPAVW